MANFHTIKGVLNSINGLILGKNGNIIKTKDATTIQARNNANGANIDMESNRFISTQTTGTSPLSVTSTTVNTNLNSDTVDGFHGTDLEYYHGVYARSTVSGLNCLPTNITTTTFTLGATTNPITYWYEGIKVIVSSNKTATLDDGAGGSTAGLYYVYFNGSTGNILATKTFPGVSNISNVIIAIVFWNGTNYGLVSDERHGYSRNCEWHQWAHSTIGARYQSGLTMTNNGGTGASATFATTLGNIWDEDINFSVPASSTFPTPNSCRLLWQNGATTYTFDSTPSTVPFKRGGNNRPVYINSTYNIIEMTSAVNRYINFFVYSTLDLHTPIYIFTETVSVATASNNGYNTPTLARAIPFPSLSGFGLSPELKPIYRAIVRADGQLQAIDTTLDDYRTVSSLPMSAGTTSTTASSVSAIPQGSLTSGSVQGQLTELDSLKQAIIEKDASNGYAGLTLFKLNLKNVTNTFINFLTNSTTASRTWIMPNKDGTVAITSDIENMGRYSTDYGFSNILYSNTVLLNKGLNLNKSLITTATGLTAADISQNNGRKLAIDSSGNLYVVFLATVTANTQ